MMKHKGKDVLKVKVEVLIKKVINLKELNGGSVFVYWRRGTSKSSGETAHVTVRNGEAIFEEKISFESKFFIDPKSQKPDEKKLSIQLKEEKKKSQGKVLGKIEFDLTSHMNSKHSQSVNLSFTKGLKPEPVLNCSINTIPLKHNNKPLVKVNNSKEASKDPRIVRTFGGDDYFLDKTDDELSDTTVDTSMASNEITSNDYSDEDINDDLAESKKDLKNEIDKLYKEIEGIESESYERLQGIKEKEKDIDSLKKQIKILVEDIAEKDAQIENYQFEKENMLNQQINEVARYSSDPSSEVELLRQEKIEKISIITAQEKEISKLKKQIKQSALSNSEFTNMSGTDLRTKYQSLQQENEQQEKLINQLEKEKQELIDQQIKGGGSSLSNTSSQITKKRSDSNGGNISPGGVGGEIVTTKSNNNAGSIEELRRQSAAFKQELDEKSLVERSIFLGEPQFRGNLPVSGINLFDGLVGLGVLKDFKIGVRVFSSINIALETTFKKCQQDANLLAYWLSTCCLVLAKIKNKTDIDQQPIGNGNGTGEAALSPISSFEYNLKTIIFKFYSKLIQNAYGKLSPILVKSILQHDILAFNSGKLQRRKSNPDITPIYDGSGNGNGGSGSSTPPINSQNGKSNHHGHHGFNSNLTSNTTLDILQEFFEILRQNYVHPSLIGQFYSQLFYFINSLLLNSLNNIKGLCSVVNGFQIKIELSKIQDWVSVCHLDESINQLAPMIETSNLLVMDKELLGDEEVLHQVCPSVSMYQIKHLLESFKPDLLNDDPIPSAVFDSIDRLIHIRNEPLHAGLDIDITFMHQLSLDFLTKDPQYGRERKESNLNNNNNNSKLSNNNSYNNNSNRDKDREREKERERDNYSNNNSPISYNPHVQPTSYSNINTPSAQPTSYGNINTPTSQTTSYSNHNTPKIQTTFKRL